MTKVITCIKCGKKVTLSDIDLAKIKDLYGNDPSIYEYRLKNFLCKDCLAMTNPGSSDPRSDLNLDGDK